MMRRHVSTLAGLAVLVIGGLLATGSPAQASAGDGGQAVWVTVTGDGSHATLNTDDVHPGWVTLHLADHTSPTSGAQIVVVQMRKGYSVSRLVADINVQVNQNSTPAQGAASTRDINKIAVALGGGDKVGTSPYFRSDTIWLPSDGRYYILNTAAAHGVAVVGDLEARGRTSGADAPDRSGTIWLGNGTADTITMTGHMPRVGTVKVANNGDGVHLLAISKIADGVTDAQVQAEYDDLMMGVFPTPANDPAGLLSQPTVSTGSDAVSPGHYSLFRYSLPAGTYLLQCFVDDATTGVPHAFMGMHLVVHIS